MKDTYQLIETIISKEARLQNKQNRETKKSLVLDCFSLACVPFSLLSRLADSLHNVSLQLISKLTMKRIIFPNSTYDQNKYCVLLTVTLLVVQPKFVVVLILFVGYIKWWTSAQTSTDCFVVGLPNKS